MNFQPKTALEIINETFNWTDTMQNLHGLPQCAIAKERKQDEYQAEPIDNLEDQTLTQFTPEEKYETIPNLSLEAIETLKKKYEAYFFINETLEIILRWKKNQETPCIESETQSLCEMDNETLLKKCNETGKYRKYCDKTTEHITSSWSQDSINGLLDTLHKTEQELEVYYYEIDRRCYLGTWFPEKT